MEIKRHLRGWAVVGLAAAVLVLVVLPVMADHTEPGIATRGSERVAGRAPTEAAQSAILTPSQPNPEHVTLVVLYQGRITPADLAQALAKLRAAGRISAVDAHSAPGRIFVLGEDTLAPALRNLPGVLAVKRADAPSEEAASAESSERWIRLHLALDPNLPAPARDRLLAQVQALQAMGQARDVIDQGLTLSLAAMPEARERLTRLPGVRFVSEAPAQTSDKVNPQSITANGFITGVVTADNGGAPIPNVGICAYQPSPYVYQCTDTNATGVYSISLPPGSYRILFIPPDNHVPEYYDNVPYSNPDSYTPVIVSDGAVTANINAGLAAGRQIIGRVTSQATTDPLSSIYVQAGDGDFYAYSYTTVSGTYTTTPGLPTGSYQVLFEDFAGIYATQYYSNVYRPSLATLVNLTSTNRTGINAALAAAANITGTVTGVGPLKNIYVYAYYGDEYTYYSSVTTNVSGTYRISGMGPIAYKLWFYDSGGAYLAEWYNDKSSWDTANPIALSSGVTKTINAQLAQAGAISGTVTAEGSGDLLGDISVRAYDAASGSQLGSATTNVSGTYRIGGLKPNTYKVRFIDNTGNYLSEYYNNKPDLASANPVNVTSGVTTTVNAALMAGGRVLGRVTDAGSGLGIGGVSVGVSRLDASGSGSATTDANGYYTSTALYSGVYRVFFNPLQPYFGEYYDNQLFSSAFKPVTVTIPFTTPNINAALRKGLLISGTVTGSGPLASVFVGAYQGTNTYYSSYAYTSGAGTYQIGPLDPGPYRVHFDPDSSDIHVGEWYNDATNYISSTVINLTSDATHVNAQLAIGGRIAGTVTGPGGVPLQDVDVSVYPIGSSNSIAYGATDANGRYATGPGLVTGSYQVFFDAPVGYASEWYNDKSSQSAANAIAVTLGLTKTNVNAQLAVAPTGAITGTLTAGDTGLPLAMWVYAYDTEGDFVNGAYASNGTYVLNGLSSGPYRLYFSAPSPYLTRYYNNKSDFASADPITVTAGMTRTNINQVFPVGGTITGTITGSGGVPGVYVFTRRVTGSYLSRSTYTGLDGAYRLDGLDAGGYKVQFTPPSPYIGEWYNDADSESAALTVTVAVSATTPNVNASLATGGVITGSVMAGDTAAPLTGALAYLYNITGTFLSSTYVDMDGRYRTSGLPPGRYKVYFNVGTWVNYIPEWYNNASTFPTALTVTVPGLGTVPNINAVLDRGGSISGRLYDAYTSQLLNGGYVYAYNANTYTFVNYNYANNFGVYQVTGLPAGQYKLYAFRSGYIDQWYNSKPDFSSAVTVTVSVPNDTSNINFYLRYYHYIYMPLIRR